MRQLIGFVAGKQVGKTLASQYICQKYGYVKFSLADPLKCAIREIFDLTDEQLWGDNKEIVDDYWRVTPRQLMQNIGTDLFRNNIQSYIPDIGDKIWVKVAERKIQQYFNQGKCVVVDDIRFPNEANMIRNLGGILVRIIRPSMSPPNIDPHISEQMNKSIMVDHVIINQSTIDDYYCEIDKLFQ